MEQMLSEWMQSPYGWFVLGIILLILEFVIPGLILIFFGLGALLTGVILWMFPMGLTMQVFVFTIASVALLLTLRKISKPILYGHSSEAFNREELKGQRAKVLTPIVPPESGRVELNGAEWNAVSDQPIEAGTTVEIDSRNNLTLKVKPIH